jgi:hypothetical protein
VNDVRTLGLVAYGALAGAALMSGVLWLHARHLARRAARDLERAMRAAYTCTEDRDRVLVTCLGGSLDGDEIEVGRARTEFVVGFVTVDASATPPAATYLTERYHVDTIARIAWLADSTTDPATESREELP